MRFYGAALVLAIAGMVRPAAGDEWPAARVKEVFSPSRNYFVRVTPGKSLGDTVGFRGAPKGPYATAEFYHQEPDRSYRLGATAPLLNPIAPVDFLVTDRGVLITFDNWHNLGYGKIVAFYTPLGKLIRAYELADLFTAGEIERFDHSVSSIAWHKRSAYLRPGGETVDVTVSDQGAGFIFESEGAYQYCENRGGTYRCRTSNQNRVWRAFQEPSAHGN